MGYVIAKYLRLSLEDAKTDSMSISSQRMMLDRFIRELRLEDAEVLEFVDNGYTGTNFERPGVQELLELVRAGRINCIIVKDFSRFGRNVVDTGYFIEHIFPLYRVRFVALSDNYDSDENKDGIGGFDVSFKFLINELYSRDLSRKIRSAKARQQELGEAITKNCAYGYRLDDSRHMVIDEAAAETVRLIFALALEGESLTGIARRLYDEKIPIPSVRKKHKRSGKQENACLWSKSTLLQMLRDEQYTGVYIARKTEAVEVGSKQRTVKDESQWLRLPGHHPAIINKADFEAAQEAITGRGPRKAGRVLDTSTRYAKNALSPLKGKVVCGACGHVMQIGVTKNPSFHCKFTHTAPDAVCHRLSIRKSDLEDAVFAACREHANGLLLRSGQGNGPEDARQEQPAGNGIRLLYERMAAGEIGKDDFRRLKAKLESEARPNKKAQSAPLAQTGPVSTVGTGLETQAAAKKILKAADLAQDHVDLLIDKVTVSPDGKVDVVWKAPALPKKFESSEDARYVG